MTTRRVSVAIDTMALVWGVAQKGTPQLRKRAKWLFTNLEREGARIIVPSVVAAEYLTSVKDSDKSNVLSAMSMRFFIAPFDVKCANLASMLWKSGSPGRKKGKMGSRICLRADTLIVATAKTYGAQHFYSGDEGCRKLAKDAGMQSFDLPTGSEYLFEQG